LPAQREALGAARDRSAPRRADRDRRRRAAAYPALRGHPPARERTGRRVGQAQLPARHPAQAAGACPDQGPAQHPAAAGGDPGRPAAPGTGAGGTRGGAGADAGGRSRSGRA
ncbi:MAG: hypothetical protein E6Q64_00625, partial [Ottowia sp.]